LRQIFREVADIPPEERERILAERRIPVEIRAEVESLLSYDSASGESLTRRVSDVAQEALHWCNGPISRECGAYRLVRLLGSGGMGAVYLGERRDGEIEHKVAIKLLRADVDRPAWRERFLRERQLLAYLNHASIARLFDAGHTPDGRPYLVMEYVDGVAIDEYAAHLDLRAKLKLFLLVCDGVSHAHRHLIVHRDLKPSNILVDSSGQPKLLDFGIAKLLDAVTAETRTVERLLTPHYASPEQLRGDNQSTATDVYSLGAVVYKVLTGRSPREPISGSSRATRGLPGEAGITGPTRLNPRLPRDIDYILRKALRHKPAERYASVDAFADDIRAFLDSRPVQARSGDTWYRIRKFLRRHRVPVAATTITLASLLLGLTFARDQRAIAQARFQQVRQLTNKVLALDEVAGGLHGSTKAMHELVAMTKQSLDALVTEANMDQGFALEVVDAYSYVARAQGICAASTSGQRAQALSSLRKASILLEPVLKANPDNRKALLTAARISHDRMIVGENERWNEEAVAQARKAVGYLDRLLALGQLSPAESEPVSELFYDMALTHKNLHMPEDGIRYARRSVEASRSSPNAGLRLSMSLSMLADLLRFTGDLEGALLAIREARANLAKAQFPNETERRSAWCRVFGREGKILGLAGGISLNRTDEAIAAFKKVFDLLEEWTQNDRGDAWSRLLFVSVGREFGDTLTLRDPKAALAVYDHALLRVREVTNHTEARRGEAELLVGSANALRRLNRISQAKDRIDLAFRLLSETGDFPAERIAPGGGTAGALRALADHLAGTGQPQRAAEIYEDLLARIMASEPDLQTDLPHAMALSHVYGTLAALHRRNGERARAEELSALRLELWRQWDRRLPDNGFVLRQLASARIDHGSRIPRFQSRDRT
jgi:serine/threonine protein kinase/tetratricopeptide (TPR) repeat protein